MTEMIEQRLKSLGIVIPNPVSPIQNYVPYVTSGSLLVISGQLSIGPDGLITGKLGRDVTIEQGQAAARICGLNVIAQIKAALGSLDRVTRIVRLGGFIHCTPDFTDAALVMNGASDLMVEVFGDKGRHARSTIGAILPRNAATEVEAMVEFS